MSRFIGYMVKLSNDKIKPSEKANNVVCMDFNGACCPERVQAPFFVRTNNCIDNSIIAGFTKSYLFNKY